MPVSTTLHGVTLKKVIVEWLFLAFGIRSNKTQINGRTAFRIGLHNATLHFNKLCLTMGLQWGYVT